MAPSSRTERGLVLLARVTNILMFLVLIVGFLVTETHSAQGCGRHWPLCDGSFTPPFDLHGVVEYGHRFISGVTGILVVWLAIWAWRRLGRHPEVRWLASLAVLFTFIQAYLGAAAVMSPTSPYILASHFGVSLVAFASVLLLDVRAHQTVAQAPDAAVSRGWTWRLRPAPSGFRRLVWLTTVYVFALVYLGALVSHTNTGLLCLGWPLCNGSLLPSLAGSVWIPYLHRVAAFVAVILVLVVHLRAQPLRKERPDLFKASAWAILLIVLQALSGWYIISSRIALGAVMLHVTLMTLLFGAVAYMALQVLPEDSA